MELKKSLGGLEVFSIAAGSMISSGLFILPAIVYTSAGSYMIIAYFLAGILVLPALFSKLELSTALPRAGGDYFFSERILGSAAGEITGFAAWFSLSMKSAFALIGIGVFATIIMPGISEFQVKAIAAGACIFFGITNLLSVKLSGRLQIVMVGGLFFILILFILTGYTQIEFGHFFDSSHNVSVSTIITATGMVFISYGGLTKVSSIAEEVHDLSRNLVFGTVAAFIAVQTAYIFVLFIVIGVTPPEVLKHTLTPISEAGVYIFPSTPLSKLLVGLTSFAGMLAFVTTANAGIMAASRSPMAMGRDGLVPEFMSTVSKRRKTPYVSVILTTLFMLAVIIVLPIEKLVKVASLFKLLLFAMVNISVIIIRTSKLSNYKPTFRTPLYPLPQIIGTGAYLFLITQMGMFTQLLALFFVILSLIWYFIYAKRKVMRKSALLYMIEGLATPDFIGEDENSDLEDELLDILIERDDIIEDRFDSVIRNAPVIDYDRTVSRDEMFDEVSKLIEEKTGINREKLRIKFNAREEETSTLIYPGVALPHAIPHVIVEGEAIFEMVIVRNKYGIVWDKTGEIVYTAFCLIGSRDERNFHLKALAAIAQILMNPKFEHEWHKAKNAKEMRTALLLAKRRREG